MQPASPYVLQGSSEIQCSKPAQWPGHMYSKVDVGGLRIMTWLLEWMVEVRKAVQNFDILRIKWHGDGKDL